MTPHELWTALPREARERVDALVVRRRRLTATEEVLKAGVVPRPALHDCFRLVTVRTEILADRLVPPPPRDADALAGKAAARALADRPGAPPRGPGDDGPVPVDARAE
ncbi:hypothetical protein [Streptomyces sp. NPDC096068]|uniref:hypothetical protein n=1 Tax=Streptomyces sp. NPDC096068 TaxID=3155424 RepID=UPI00332859BD